MEDFNEAGEVQDLASDDFLSDYICDVCFQGIVACFLVLMVDKLQFNWTTGTMRS